MEDKKRYVLRIDKDVFKKAKLIADLKEMSLNKYLNLIISKEVNSILSDEDLIKLFNGVNDE